MFLKKTSILLSIMIVSTVAMSGCVPTNNSIDSTPQEIGIHNDVYANDSIILEIIDIVGQQGENLKTLKSTTETVALVNGIPITVEELQLQFYCQEMTRYTAEEIVRACVRKKAIKCDAQKQGIFPDDEEVSLHVSAMKNAYEANEDVKGLDITLYKPVEYMGITVEEYLDLQYLLIYDIYQEMEFKQYIVAQYDELYYESYVEDLVRNARIERTIH